VCTRDGKGVDLGEFLVGVLRFGTIERHANPPAESGSSSSTLEWVASVPKECLRRGVLMSPVIVGIGGSTSSTSVSNLLLHRCLDHASALGAATQLFDG